MSGPPWQILNALPAWDITEIPRRDGPRTEFSSGAGLDRGIAQRVQALAAAYQCGAPVALGWIRDRTGSRVRVICAGPGLATGSDGAGQTLLTLPAGARAQRLPAGGAAPLFASLACWTPVAIVADALFAEHDHETGAKRAAGVAPPSLEEVLLGSWPGPFGWIVIAEPVTDGQLRSMTSEVALEQLAAQRLDSPRAQLAARRAASRHAELRRAAATGLWSIRQLAGGESPDAAARVAGLLCASVDLDGLPYALVPEHGCGTLAQMLGGAGQPGGAGESDRPGHGLLREILAMQPAGRTAASAQPPSPSADPRRGAGTGARPESGDDEPVPEFPCAGSSRLLAVLARPPAREVPGIRFALRPDFDVTPETGPPAVRAQGGVPLGTVLDQNRVPAGELAVPLGSLNRHVFVCGATGAGKSQTIRHLLESAAGAGIPWLVIEPAKAEYRLMAVRLPDAPVVVIRPGDLDVAPASVNPLEPAAGPDGSRFPLQAHADLVCAMFLAAFEADEPFPQVLAAALARCYEQAGWDLVTGEPAVEAIGYPSLADLQAAAMSVVEEIGYGREITGNVRGFVRIRIGSLLLGTAGRFLGGGHPLDLGALLDSNVVLEIEDCGDDTTKAFVTGTMLIRLTEYLRMRSRAEGPVPPRLRHLTVVEEAHRLLRQPPHGTGSGPAAQAVQTFAALLAEIRVYGEGLVIAEQIPAKLVPDVIKNTAVKIVHRLPALDDRDAVGATMNLTPDQSKYLISLVPGEAAVHTDGMDFPVLARMPDGTARETGTPARAAPPDAIIAPRSASCGLACRSAPCTARQMRAAQNAASRDPRITFWAELSVLAHLTGQLMPMPGTALAVGLLAMDSRLRECALSQATDDAAASRSPVISTRLSPPALAAHVTAAIRAALDGQGWLCDRQEPQWLAPAYRWALVLDSLKSFHQNNENAGRHPFSVEWEAAYHRTIPGQTCAAQLDAVQRWYDADQRSQTVVHGVAYGTRSESAIERAIGARCLDEDWEQRLADGLSVFRECRWPADYLCSSRYVKA